MINFVQLALAIYQQNKDMENQKLNLLKLNSEYQELRNKVVKIGRSINPNLHYRMKEKYCAPSLGSGASAINDANMDIDKLLRNIISAGKENIKQNKMIVDLNSKSKKNNGWEI